MLLRPQQLKIGLIMLGCQIYTSGVTSRKLNWYNFYIVHSVHYDILQLW